MINRKLLFFLPSYSLTVLQSSRPTVLPSYSLTVSLSLCLLFSTISYGQQWGDYTFYSVQNSTSAVLLDTNGTTYHTWSFGSSARTGYSSYLLSGGTVLRTVARQGNSFQGGGMCGQVQKVDWDGNVLWNYICSTTTYCSHHDIHPMPNGNVLLIVYELKSSSEVTQAGCKWAHTMWPDMIMEVQPTGASSGEIVWEWHAWDHLVQDYDPTKDNYGVVADHPELLDINYANSQQTKDWMHVNGIDYNEELDQIVISSHFLNELYVIDHSTTIEEAAGHTGGNSGKGGDILYRWGNPAAYDAGGSKIFNVVHDAHWISPGSYRAGTLVGFNNNGVSQTKSSVDIIYPPYDGYNYEYTPGSAYLPSTYDWRHACNGHTNNEGGCHNLPNGNILVCITQAGFIYEVDSNNNMLWSKNLSGGGSSNARRYSKCYVEGTLIEAPLITQHNDTLFSSYGVKYQWFMNGLPLAGGNDAYLVPMLSGAYQVSITDEGGCDSELSEPLNYEMIGITEQEPADSPFVYPVPTHGMLTLDESISPEDFTMMRLFDQSGRKVLTITPQRSFDISQLDTGIYFLVLTGEKLPVRTAKIILIK
jgi:hypothetical protein